MPGAVACTSSQSRPCPSANATHIQGGADSGASIPSTGGEETGGASSCTASSPLPAQPLRGKIPSGPESHRASMPAAGRQLSSLNPATPDHCVRGPRLCQWISDSTWCHLFFNTCVRILFRGVPSSAFPTIFPRLNGVKRAMRIVSIPRLREATSNA